MMREPVQPQTHNPALEREKKNPEQTQQPRNQQPNQPAIEPMLENSSTAQVEVLLEQIAHDMTYENKLKPEQQQLLAKFGYSDGGLIDGPFGFEMRSFVPSKPEYPNPILAFRGTEFSKIKDLVADLEPQSVGLQQFNANRRRIELELQKLSKRGKVWLTGHSLGGALAQLAGSEFADLTGRIITFQSPGIDAKHVAQLKKHNKANPDKAVQSTHYQVAGDVVSGAGEALTPGELVRFEMNPSSGATMKHYAVGIIAGAVVGPGTGVVVKEAADKVSKHRAFPVTNAVQENPAFQDLFENGKKFDKVAGISDDTFKAKATLNADTFQNTRVSEFLRHTLGKQSFEIEHAVSDWGGDAKAREFAERYKQNIPQFTATQLLEQLSNLLNGWVSDDDVQAFETICYGVSNPKIMSEIYGAISPRLEELHSDHQRKWVEDAINFKPVAKPVQRKQASIQRDALNSQPADSSSQQIQNLSGGNLLRSNQRKELEDHFGVELGDVRLHTDEGAQKLAKDLNAKAATIGEHIVLAESSSLTDKELIGHEVAHVIQQRGGKVGTGIDPDSSLETEAKLEGKNFAAGAKTRGKKAMLEPKKAFSSDTVQREVNAKKTTTPWERDFTGSVSGMNFQMQLFRTSEGTLTGTYTLEKQAPVRVEGKILNSEDNDLFLTGTDGSRWHGKYTTQNTLMFGNVELPKKNLKNLELRVVTNSVMQAPVAPSASVPAQQTPSNIKPATNQETQTPTQQTTQTPTTTQNSSDKWTREFNGQLDGKYSIHMHLERDGTKLSGSYYYAKQGASNAIALTGVIDEKTKVVKLEGNGEIFTGAFMGEKGDRLEGNWIGGDKNLKFSVKSSDLTNTKSTNLLDLTGLKGSQLIIARIFNTHGSQLVQLCNQIGVNPGVFAAIIATESQGTASSGGQMLIRFEVHKFFESWGVNNQKLFNQHFDFRRSGAIYKGHKFSVDGKNWTTLHPTGTPSDLPLQYQALDLAKSLGTNAVEPANACLGMGLGQVQGFNYQSLGFKSASEMFDTLSSDESEQVKSVFSYVNARPKCLKAMQSQNWNNIELYYNGGGQNGLYADAMKNYFGLLLNLAAIQKIDLATGKKVGV